MNNDKKTKEAAVALAIFVKLMRAADSVSADVHNDISHTNLTVSQFGILEALYHLGPMSQKELGEKILKSAGNITMVIGNLERQGFVTRKKNSEDRRQFIIELTGSGKKQIAAIFPAHAETIHKRMSVLTHKEMKTLNTLLRKLKPQTP